MAPTANSRRWGFRTLLVGCAIAIIAVLVTASAEPTRVASSPWPMVGHDARHTGLSPIDTKRNNGQLRWTFPIQGGVVASPVIGADGTIYALAADFNTLYAINPDGTQKWRSDTIGGFGADGQTSPAIGADGTLYSGCGRGDGGSDSLCAVTPDGRLKWKWNPTLYAPVLVPPLAITIGADGTVYVGGSHNLYVYALNPDGSLKWQFDFPAVTAGCPGFSSPAIGPDGTIYVASSCETVLWALKADGSLTWTFSDLRSEFIGAFGPPSVGRDGTIYLGAGYGGGAQGIDGQLYAISPNGKLKWKFDTPAQGIGSVAIGADRALYFGSGDANGNGIVYSVNPDSSLKWRSTVSPGPDLAFMDADAPAVSADGTVYITSHADGNLYAINRNGSKKWKSSLAALGYASPAIGADGTVYIGDQSGLEAVGSGPLAAILELFPTALNFGAVEVGKSSVMTLVINDRGGRGLTGSIDASGLKPPFAAVAGAGRFQIKFREGHVVSIKFAPRATGSFSGTITITSNDPNNPSAAVTVQGSGD